jgi:dCMP deaminase
MTGKRDEGYWQKWFLGLAEHVASASKDPSTKVGSVIVRPDRTVVSVGYNGFPRGTDDYHHILADRSLKLKRTVHAEVNAILSARERLTGYTLYVTPLYPCAACAGIIIQSGISKVVAHLAKEPNPTWIEDFKAATRMFREAGVDVELVTVESNPS